MIFLRKDVIIEAAVIIIKTKEKFIMKQDMIVILDLGSTENTVIAVISAALVYTARFIPMILPRTS